MRSIISSISIAAVAAMGLGFSASTASAANFCYNLVGFADTLDVQAAQKKNGHRLLYGTWNAPSYTLVIAGALEEGGTHIGVTGTNGTPGVFDDNLICGLDGVVDGPWQINCAGGDAGNVQYSGDTIAKVPCGAPGKSKGAGVGD